MEVPEVAAFRQRLYAMERSVHYSAGSLLLYRYDLWHRGRPILPSARRIVMNLAWRKRSCAHFITSWQQGWAKSMQASAFHALRSFVCVSTFFFFFCSGTRGSSRAGCRIARASLKSSFAA